MCCLSLCVLVPGGLKCMCPGLKFRPRLLLPNISEIPCFSVVLQRFYFFLKTESGIKIQDVRGFKSNAPILPRDTQALHQDHGENNYCSPCSILFQGSCLITVLHPSSCHTRMGTAKGQMAADGESEEPLQI